MVKGRLAEVMRHEILNEEQIITREIKRLEHWCDAESKQLLLEVKHTPTVLTFSEFINRLKHR